MPRSLVKQNEESMSSLKNDSVQSEIIKNSFGIGHYARLFGCGILGGAITAGLFNPWDRALYLSVREQRSFLLIDNFRNPFQGVSASIWFRAIAGGLYYPMESIFDGLLPQPHHPLRPFAVGLFAGLTSGALLHPGNVVKFVMWGDDKATFWNTYSQLKRRGWQSFSIGLRASLMRDMAFGFSFSGSRAVIIDRFQWVDQQIQQQQSPLALIPDRCTWCEALAATVSGGLAVILTSPFNYARNMQLAKALEKEQPPTIREVLTGLHKQTMKQTTILHRIQYLQDRLKVGWGSLRVATGMGLGLILYRQLETLTNTLFPKNE